jgi:Anti-sigma factor NepR
MSNEKQNKPAPTLEPAVMRTIGRELRAVYADIVAEGMPEQFVEILRKLDEPSSEGEAR